MNKEKFITVLNKFIANSITPIKLTWSLLCLFILIRIIECLSFSSNGCYDYFLGIRYDFLFAGIIGIILIFIYQLLPYRFHKPATIISIIVLFFLILINWILSEYYLTTLIPLDQSILIYPLSEIYYIASSSAYIGFSQIFKIVLIVLASFAIPIFLIRKLRIRSVLILLSFSPFVITLLFFNNITPDIRNFENNKYFYKQINKTSYLIKQLVKNYSNTIDISDYDIPQISKEYQALRSDFNYLEPMYPFIRENTDEDVIGKYFDFNDDKPNFVFIIVESLSRDFSGPDARINSFTPFLDSLAGKSLFWKNFVVTSERTFNVLPSALASLPYGDKGFMALIEKNNPYPEFLSLTSILKQGGYHSNFFYGGWAYFDYMSVFLENTGIDFILDDKGFGIEYNKIDSLESGFTWGYPDHAVYQRSLEVLDSLPGHPRLDIYLTLSMHDPFFPPSSDYWKDVFNNYLQNLNIENSKLSFYKDRQKQFSTILYADNAIRDFFYDYQERDEYENTIFIIFGDHHMPITDYTPLEKYHVPLIIYSPMLTKAETFPAISSTADITPTILSMMNENFDKTIPRWVHWLGCPLDTNLNFQNKKFIPFMRINRNIDELLWKDLFLSEGRLFKIDDQMNINPVFDNKKLHMMEEKLKYFNILNQYACHSNAIYKPLKQSHYDENH